MTKAETKKKFKPNKDYSKDLVVLYCLCTICTEEMRFDENSEVTERGFVNVCRNGHREILKYPYPFLKRGRGSKR